MDPFQLFQHQVESTVSAALKAVEYDGEAPQLEVPPNPEMGQLGLPCFTLARHLRAGPPQIAGKIAEAAATVVASHEWIHKAEAVGPYCNFWIDAEALAKHVLSDPDAAVTCPPTGQKILLEHTSANPNGPLHVGRARNPIVGDSIGRLLRAAGHDVEVQYYMDNLGRQVALLAWGKWNIPESELPPVAEGREDKLDHVLVRYYQAANEKREADPEIGKEVHALVAQLESADQELLPRVREVYEACFAGMQASLNRLGVYYDSIKDESDVVLDGSVDRVLEELSRSPRAGVEDDGAKYLDLSDLLKGQKDKFFFARRDGTSVYATRDIAYHRWKAEQVGEGLLVDVLGEDHRLQSLQVGTALEELGVKRPDVVFYSFVSLPEGKMSTRANRVVFLDDLLDDAAARAYEEVKTRRGDELDEAQLQEIAEAVGIAAIRFNIARIQPEKPIEFKWEDALDFDGDSAPYLMYAYARAASLLRAATELELPEGAPMGSGEEKLALAIARMPQAIKEAAGNYAPHRFASYAIELASAWNEYYRDHRIVGHDNFAAAATRLQAVKAAHFALGRALEILGIPRLESM